MTITRSSILLSLILLVAGPVARAADGTPPDISNTPAFKAFITDYVAAVNAKDAVKFLACVHPECRPILAHDFAYAEEQYKVAFHRTIPAKYRLLASPIDADDPLPFAEVGSRYPIRPTYQVQIDYQLTPSSSVGIVLLVVQDQGKWWNVVPTAPDKELLRHPPKEPTAPDAFSGIWKFSLNRKPQVTEASWGRWQWRVVLSAEDSRKATYQIVQTTHKLAADGKPADAGKSRVVIEPHYLAANKAGRIDVTFYSGDDKANFDTGAMDSLYGAAHQIAIPAMLSGHGTGRSMGSSLNLPGHKLLKSESLEQGKLADGSLPLARFTSQDDNGTTYETTVSLQAVKAK